MREGGEVATHHEHSINILYTSLGNLMWVFGGFSFSGHELSPFPGGDRAHHSEQLARKKSESLPVRPG